MAAAAAGNAMHVRDLIGEARSVADRIPDQANHYRLSFGSTNVGIHHVSALVSMGEGGLAVEASERIDQAGIEAIRRERRANHYVDVARGFSQAGQREEALQKLLEAERLAPREVNCRPIARATIREPSGAIPWQDPRAAQFASAAVGDRRMSQVLYIIACGAPPARDVSRLVEAAQDSGWDACVLAHAVSDEVPRLSLRSLKQTGHPVRSDYKDPSDPDSLPAA